MSPGAANLAGLLDSPVRQLGERATVLVGRCPVRIWAGLAQAVARCAGERVALDGPQRLGSVGTARFVTRVRVVADTAALDARCLIMARHKRPRRYTIVGDLSRNSAGKVLKGILRERVTEAAFDPAGQGDV